MGEVKKRMFEPSTWAGVAAMLEGLKFIFPQWAGVLVGVQAMAGGVAVVLREAGNK